MESSPPAANIDDAIFRNAFSQAGVSLALLDLDGRFLRVNRMMCTLLGYEEAELQARDFASITHPDDIEPSRLALRRFRAGQCRSACLEKRYLQKSGRAIDALVSVTLVSDDAG